MGSDLCFETPLIALSLSSPAALPVQHQHEGQGCSGHKESCLTGLDIPAIKFSNLQNCPLLVCILNGASEKAAEETEWRQGWPTPEVINNAQTSLWDHKAY